MLDSCAADGMCATRCPVGIDTGRLTKATRAARNGGKAGRIADWLGGHMGAVTRLTRVGLGLAGGAHALLGDGLMGALTGGARRLSGGRLPLWNPYMPGPAGPLKPVPVTGGDAPRVVLFPSCASRSMGLDGAMRDLAQACAEQVVVPEEIACCGFAGDRGFTFPELNASALQGLRRALPEDCEGGYSNSRTCEIGLSLHSGLHYRSIVYLVDRCSEPAQRTL